VTHYFPEDGTECTPSYGTGFLVEFPSPDTRIGLVTNRHVTDAVFFNEEDEGAVLKSVLVQWWQSNVLRLEHMITDPQPLYHSDPLIDVAVIPIAATPDKPIEIVGAFYGDVEKFVAGADPDTLMFNHAFSWVYLLECEELWPQLEPGEFVAFPGYPMWYDRLQIRPVMRSGLIASDPQTNYRSDSGGPTKVDGNHQVLFDAFSTKGSSGSPVYVAQRGMPPTDIPFPFMIGGQAMQLKLAYPNYHRSFLIGINATHYNDTGIPRPNEHAGLSRMHKLSAIMDILRANVGPHDPDARRISVKARIAGTEREELILSLREEGKTYKEIAAEVGCSASTVGGVVRRFARTD
jgi:DNA-binding CsgD family transcriptional regulator